LHDREENGRVVLWNPATEGRLWRRQTELPPRRQVQAQMPRRTNSVRDDFTKAVKEKLAKRAGYRYSNPQCRRPTIGPQEQEAGTLSIGVAAHITAAAPQGPRRDPNLSVEERRDAANGIWLCEICGKMVDADRSRYPISLLQDWKEIAEATALLELKGYAVGPDRRALLKRLEEQMPELFADMHQTLNDDPFFREFILLARTTRYNANPNSPVWAFFYEDHPDLRPKIRLLENNGLVQQIAAGNADRFRMSEELVEYFRSGK
jgi:hypothetical protein